MKNIKFIEGITFSIPRARYIVSNYIYYALDGGNKAKLWCEEMGVEIEILNPQHGMVDNMFLPFKDYFSPVTENEKGRTWTQYIDGDDWKESRLHPELKPKESDYKKLAYGIEQYLRIFEK